MKDLFTQSVRVEITRNSGQSPKKRRNEIAEVWVQSSPVIAFDLGGDPVWVSGYEASCESLHCHILNLDTFCEWMRRLDGDPRGKKAPPFDFQVAAMFQVWRGLAALDPEASPNEVMANAITLVQGLGKPVKRMPTGARRRTRSDKSFGGSGCRALVRYDARRSWTWADLPLV